MATVDFYEKPGCINNTRQKALLVEAGHYLVVHNLLLYPWVEQPEKLRSFFAELPVADWFNRSAPAVKNGEVIPENLTEQQAIKLMINTPLLIRRPLLEVNGRRSAGFDWDKVQSWLDLQVSEFKQDLETCPNQRAHKQACQS